MTGKTRILFVDEDHSVLQRLQKQLRPMRGTWEMAFVDGAVKAMEELAAAPFEVVVADVTRLPDMDGREFLNRVMWLHPTCIRIVLADPEAPDLVLRMGEAAHQYLAKPCDLAVLSAVVQSTREISNRLRSDRIREVLGGIAQLPVVPELYLEIVALVERESTTAQDLGRVVQRDPGMTANLLKLVNSAYFGLRQRVSDPVDAVAFLGLDTLKSLALIHGVFHQIRALPPGFERGHLWQHSLEAAALARAIARAERFPAGGESAAFTGGLLHDVGLLILASGLEQDYLRVRDLLRAEPVEVAVAEVRVLGVHHAEVGAHLLGLWNLPAPVVEAVARHHYPPGPDSGGPALAVYAAETLLAARGDHGVFGQAAPGTPLPPALASRLEAWRPLVAQ